MNHSTKIYIFQHKHNNRLIIKTKNFGSLPTATDAASRVNLIRIIRTGSSKNTVTIREQLIDHFGNLSNVSPSKVNCDTIDQTALTITGYLSIPSTFEIIRKFEFIWPEAAKNATKRTIPESDQHLRVYPLYLHLITTHGNPSKLWLSDTILNHATESTLTQDNPQATITKPPTRSEIIVVYIYHTVAERLAALMAVATHEGDWESPRNIGLDQYSLKALQQIMANINKSENFDLTQLTQADVSV